MAKNHLLFEIKLPLNALETFVAKSFHFRQKLFLFDETILVWKEGFLACFFLLFLRDFLKPKKLYEI